MLVPYQHTLVNGTFVLQTWFHFPAPLEVHSKYFNMFTWFFCGIFVAFWVVNRSPYLVSWLVLNLGGTLGACINIFVMLVVATLVERTLSACSSFDSDVRLFVGGLLDRCVWWLQCTVFHWQITWWRMTSCPNLYFKVDSLWARLWLDGVVLLVSGIMPWQYGFAPQHCLSALLPVKYIKKSVDKRVCSRDNCVIVFSKYPLLITYIDSPFIQATTLYHANSRSALVFRTCPTLRASPSNPCSDYAW